jgi:hypothetical protein
MWTSGQGSGTPKVFRLVTAVNILTNDVLTHSTNNGPMPAVVTSPDVAGTRAAERFRTLRHGWAQRAVELAADVLESVVDE